MIAIGRKSCGRLEKPYEKAIPQTGSGSWSSHKLPHIDLSNLDPALSSRPSPHIVFPTMEDLHSYLFLCSDAWRKHVFAKRWNCGFLSPLLLSRHVMLTAKEWQHDRGRSTVTRSINIRRKGYVITKTDHQSFSRGKYLGPSLLSAISITLTSNLTVVWKEPSFPTLHLTPLLLAAGFSVRK